MDRTLARWIATALGSLWIASPAAALYSIDGASVHFGASPDDVLADGPAVWKQGTSLGLADVVGAYDDLNALSFGEDPVLNKIWFSVDRVAVGTSGSAVNIQAAPALAEASADTFLNEDNSTNSLWIDETERGLTPGFFGDDLDALSRKPSDSLLLYFSIDKFSTNNGGGSGTGANDIYVNDLDTVFASGEIDIGLEPGDDIDALVLHDVKNPGQIDVTLDYALFSLSPFSTSVLEHGASPADIFITEFDGTYQIWRSASTLGLRSDDNLNALMTPEPSTGALVALGLAALAARAARRRTSGADLS